MLDPICLENDQVIVHGFRSEDLARYETLVKEIYLLFSDADTLQFLPVEEFDLEFLLPAQFPAFCD